MPLSLYRIKVSSLLKFTDKGDINLTVKVIGTPPPDTQWFKDNKPIVRDSRHIIKQQKDGIFCLTVKGVTSADQGTYECSATSKTGSAKRTFDVEIDGATRNQKTGGTICHTIGSCKTIPLSHLKSLKKETSNFR